jgi:hypothetical protein
VFHGHAGVCLQPLKLTLSTQFWIVQVSRLLNITLFQLVMSLIEPEAVGCRSSVLLSKETWQWQ